jgi:hypothetical protein
MHQASQGLPFAPLNGIVSEAAALNRTENAEMTPGGDEGGLLQRFSSQLFEEPALEETTLGETAIEMGARDALPEQSFDANADHPMSPRNSPAELQSTTTGHEDADLERTNLESADLVRTDLESRDLERKDGERIALRPSPVDWSSALKARSFFEAVVQTRSPGAFVRLWRARRGYFYLAVAVVLVLVAIRSGILSNHPVSATNGKPTASGGALRHRPPADDLSLFDKFLISLGLAEAPDAPEYKYMGNPRTQVWIDTHTALYYCPGSEFYGKTPQGRFSNQHDAQLDQFEPATRRACD